MPYQDPEPDGNAAVVARLGCDAQAIAAVVAVEPQPRERQDAAEGEQGDRHQEHSNLSGVGHLVARAFRPCSLSYVTRAGSGSTEPAEVPCYENPAFSNIGGADFRVACCNPATQ